MMKIRDFQDADVETFVAIRNRAVPAEPTSAEQFRQAPQDGHFTRTLEIEGEAQGFGVLRPWPFGGGPGRWAIGVYVHEDLRRRGLGRKIYEDLCMEADRRGWESLRSGYYESTDGAAGFSKALGFVPWLREDAFSLDLDRDFKEDMAGARARLKLDDVELSTFDVWNEPEKEKLFYEFCLPIFRMVPEMQGDPDPDFETFHKNNLRQPPFREDSLFIALMGGKLLGYTQHRLPPGGQPFIHMTGVHPDHQRKGVARVLKLHSQQVQKDRGFHRVGTGSAEDNKGMQALNRDLGFYVSDSYLFVKRDRDGGPVKKE